MTTTTTAPTLPADPPADVVALGQSFDVAAITPGFGVEILFSRWLELRIAAAHHSPDILAGVSLAAALDAVLSYRASPGRGFNILTIVTESHS